jgi:predicted enzyme related to lactoylglutathione lyase
MEEDMGGISYDGGLTAAIGCTDFAKSAAWYQDVLGFKMLYEMKEMGWGEFASPVARVNVGLSQKEKVPAGGNAVLTWGVKDIDAARAALEAKKVRFDGATQTIPGMVKLATFFDPDGNALMLYQDLAGAHKT